MLHHLAHIRANRCGLSTLLPAAALPRAVPELRASWAKSRFATCYNRIDCKRVQPEAALNSSLNSYSAHAINYNSEINANRIMC